MKPNTKSIYFKISLACFAVFFIQLFILRGYAQDVVESGDKSEPFAQIYYWIGVGWVSLGSLFWYKSTKYKQTLLTQALVLILSPIVLSPVIGLIYVIVVLLPLYSQVGESLN